MASDQGEIGPGEEGTHVLAVDTSLEVERRMACRESLGQVEILADQNADLVAAHSSREMEVVAGIEGVEVGVVAAVEVAAAAAAVAEIVEMVEIAEVVPESAPEASMQGLAVWRSTSRRFVSGMSSLNKIANLRTL